MDILGADFYGAVDQIRTRLGKNAICIQLPIGKEEEFKGIIDLFEMKAYIYNDDKGEDISIVDIPDDMNAFGDMVWDSLNADNKVSLFIRFIDIETGRYESKIYNKNV